MYNGKLTLGDVANDINIYYVLDAVEWDCIRACPYLRQFLHWDKECEDYTVSPQDYADACDFLLAVDAAYVYLKRWYTADYVDAIIPRAFAAYSPFDGPMQDALPDLIQDALREMDLDTVTA